MMAMATDQSPRSVIQHSSQEHNRLRACYLNRWTRARAQPLHGDLRQFTDHDLRTPTWNEELQQREYIVLRACL